MEGDFLQIPLWAGLIFILLGLLHRFFPAKKKNYFYGYRSPLAFKSSKSWEFAQSYAAKEIMKFGLLLILLSFIGEFVELNGRIRLYASIAIVGAVAVGFIADVEVALYNRFRSRHKR